MPDSWDIVDIEREEPDEERRLRQVRQKRQSIRRLEANRTTSRLAAFGLTLFLCGLYALLLAWPRWRVSDTPAAAMMTAGGIALCVTGVRLLRRWRRRTLGP